MFNEYPFVHCEEGLPKLSDEVFDGREPSMIVIDASCCRGTLHSQTVRTS